MMHFKRTLLVKHHPTGDHYSLSIPSQVAQALGLQDGGGLVSIEVKLHKLHNNKKGSCLKAYRDCDFAWPEQFDPSQNVIPISFLVRRFELASQIQL
jgi:hypothetical protein